MSRRLLESASVAPGGAPLNASVSWTGILVTSVLRFPSTFLAGATLLSALGIATYLHFKDVRWVPLEVPIELTQGSSARGNFTVDMGSRYFVAIDIQRSVHFERLREVIGEGGKNQGLIDVEWEVTSAGSVVASGRSSEYAGAYWGPTCRRMIGEFQGERGMPYELSARVHSSIQDQTKLEPKLIVSIDQFRNKSVLFRLSSARLLGNTLFALAGIAVLRALYLWSRRHSGQLTAA